MQWMPCLDLYKSSKRSQAYSRVSQTGRGGRQQEHQTETKSTPPPTYREATKSKGQLSPIYIQGFSPLPPAYSTVCLSMESTDADHLTQSFATQGRNPSTNSHIAGGAGSPRPPEYPAHAVGRGTAYLGGPESDVASVHTETPLLRTHSQSSVKTFKLPQSAV